MEPRKRSRNLGNGHRLPQTRIGKSLVYWKFHMNAAGTLMWAVPSQGAPRLWTPQNGCRFEDPEVTIPSAGQCTANIDGTGFVSRSPDLQHLQVWDIDATQPTSPRLSLPTGGSANPVFLSDDSRWLVCCDGASAFIWDLHASQSQDFAYKCDVTLAVDSRVKVALFNDRWLVLTTGEYFLPGKSAVAWDLSKGAGAPPVVKLDTAIVRDNILIGTNAQVGLRLWRLQDEEMCQSAPMDLPDPQGACWVSAGCKMIAMRDNQGRSHVWNVERLLQANR